MGSSCGNSDSITINENGENLNNNNHHQRHNQINNKSKKNDIQNKLSNLKDSDKFKEMPYYDNDIYSGESIKKMKSYKCSLPYDELQNLRNEFWTTRKDNKRVWQIIRSCCETDGETAYQILQSYGLFCLDNCISNICDPHGNIYFIPNFMINDPVYLKEFHKEEKVVEETYKVLFVDVFNNKEYEQQVKNTNTGEQLYKMFAIVSGQDLTKINIRMIYKGHEITKDHCLYQHKIDPLFPKILVSIRPLELDEL